MGRLQVLGLSVSVAGDSIRMGLFALLGIVLVWRGALNVVNHDAFSLCLDGKQLQSEFFFECFKY